MYKSIQQFPEFTAACKGYIYIKSGITRVSQ